MAVKESFKIQSLEYAETELVDIDKGIIRVSSTVHRALGERNTLVRVSNVNGRSIVRLMRSCTRKKPFEDRQIALQYEDRRELGIPSAGSVCELKIERINFVLGVIAFNFLHTSHLVRLQAWLSLILPIAFGLIGWLLGAALK
jgi:hypothetical protein